MLSLQIEKRLIIPVRLVPLVTGWKVTPAQLSGALSGEIKALKGRIQAHRLTPEHGHDPVPESDWGAFFHQISSFGDEDVDSGTAGNRLLPTRCREAAKMLPAGVFLWADDLEKTWRSPGFAEEPGSTDPAAPGNTLDYSPWIPPDLIQSVYEGFEELLISSAEPGRGQSPLRIRARELETYLRLDPFYGIESARPEATIEEIYSDNVSNPRFQNFRRRYLQIPYKNQNQHHLIRLWCSLMGLPAYRDSQTLRWGPKEFLDHWSADFDLKSEETKDFLRNHGWPLPTLLFLNEIDNTHRKLALDEATYDAAVHVYLDVLPKLQAELISLKAIQPESMEARQNLKNETLSIERRIEQALKREVFGRPETPIERRQRLKRWFAEEEAKNPIGPQKRTAEREGISRQTLSAILKR
jgi:hypothetical protein